MPDRRSGLLTTALVAAALLALTSPLGARPEAVDAALSAAADAAAQGQGIKVEAELRKALSAGASRSDVAARMGEAYLLQGDLRNAREWLEPAQFSKNDEALGWRLTGRLLRLEGKLPEAGRAFDRVLALTPNDPLLWVDIARLRYVGGEHLLAIAAAERALQAGPDNPR
ncbi:MAG: tetratricopeptide repeat protein, partial [Novosphingobium sp.]